jgi:hypothetical protein
MTGTLRTRTRGLSRSGTSPAVPQPTRHGMSIVSRPARTLLAACLFLAVLIGAGPGRASALEPPRPLPGYRPEFVTETDVRPWTDCLWASGAMLLDKWTNGDRTIAHRALRRLSGDHGGSSLEDLGVAFRRLGFKLSVSAGGHGTLTWSQFIARLKKGAGAVVLGDDSLLPRWYGRWDYAFWKKRGEKDNHAVYVERYDHGRVWIMDPLARGEWQGEWISADALYRFAWFEGGRIEAVTTPTAAAPPFKGVRLTSPRITLSPGAVAVTWSMRAPRRWHYPGADIHVKIVKSPNPVLAAIRSAQLAPRVTTDRAPARPVATVARDRRHLKLVTPLPAKPGAYAASMSLAERRFGRTVLRSQSVGVFVPGPRRATLRLNVTGKALEAGGAVRLNVVVTNSGEVTWADPASGYAASQAAPKARHTRMTARWIRLDGPSTASVDAASGSRADRASAGKASADVAGPDVSGSAAGGASGDATGRRAIPLSVDLARVPLAPGGVTRVRHTVLVPEVEGRWALVVDLVDDVDGAFSALGSTPAVALFQIVAPRGITPVE